MISKDNSFDLVRLAAAIQVCFMHAAYWLKVEVNEMLLEVSDWFPGVPVFFMVSGCLVTNSFSSRKLPEYIRNRCYRIFPGLWCCLVVSFILVAFRDGLVAKWVVAKSLLWFVLQGTVFQFVDFIGNIGVTNGVLWSISTELQFYILLPLCVYYGRSYLSDRKFATGAILVFAISSCILHTWVLENQSLLLPRSFPFLYASVFTNGYFLHSACSHICGGTNLPRYCGINFTTIFYYI